MATWKEFSKVQNIMSALATFVGAIVVLGGFIYAGYDHLATKAYADEGDAENAKSLIVATQEAEGARNDIEQNIMISANRAEIWRAKREIKRLQRERIKEGHNPVDIILIDADIAEYKELIECIRDAKELCY